MAKLAEGTGMKVPEHAANALNQAKDPAATAAAQGNMPPIATQCFMLSNSSDPPREGAQLGPRSRRMWLRSATSTVVFNLRRQASSQGNVYVKCPSTYCAVAAVNALHGRWFRWKGYHSSLCPVVNYQPVPGLHEPGPSSYRPPDKLRYDGESPYARQQTTKNKQHGFSLHPNMVLLVFLRVCWIVWMTLHSNKWMMWIGLLVWYKMR